MDDILTNEYKEAGVLVVGWINAPVMIVKLPPSLISGIPAG